MSQQQLFITMLTSFTIKQTLLLFIYLIFVTYFLHTTIDPSPSVVFVASLPSTLLLVLLLAVLFFPPLMALLESFINRLSMSSSKDTSSSFLY